MPLHLESDARPDPAAVGESLLDLASSPDRPRTVFSEYHATGTRHGYYMLSDGRWKYVHYTHEAAQLFDLEADPMERRDLAASPAHRHEILSWEARLRALLDPEAVDARARADQAARIAAFGGEQAVLRRGLTNSPIPGERPTFR